MKALPKPPAAYRIIVAENSHYQDKDAEYEIPGAATVEEALVVCRQIVDDSLKEFATPGATPRRSTVFTLRSATIRTSSGRRETALSSRLGNTPSQGLKTWLAEG